MRLILFLLEHSTGGDHGSWCVSTNCCCFQGWQNWINESDAGKSYLMIAIISVLFPYKLFSLANFNKILAGECYCRSPCHLWFWSRCFLANSSTDYREPQRPHHVTLRKEIPGWYTKKRNHSVAGLSLFFLLKKPSIAMILKCLWSLFLICCVGAFKHLTMTQ